MSVTYTAHPAYPGNPFIEALPPRFSREALLSSISSFPCYNREMCKAEANVRLSLLATIGDLYVPLDFSVDIYQTLFSGIERSFLSKSALMPVRRLQMELNPLTIKKDYLRYVPTPNNGASALGVPGVGKTSTVTRIAELLPQTIIHQGYHGYLFDEIQVNYIMVECPGDCSVKSLCLSIIDSIRDALDISAIPHEIHSSKRESVDVLTLQISQYCRKYHIGAIIIDEIQNVRAGQVKKNGTPTVKNHLVSFLVQLINSVGVFVFFVGTPEANDVFDKGRHLFRRTRGLRVTSLTYGKDYNTFLNCLWEYQFTSCTSILNDDIRKMVYDITQGIPALISQLIISAQEEAILSGDECVSPAVIFRAAEKKHIKAAAPAPARILSPIETEDEEPGRGEREYRPYRVVVSTVKKSPEEKKESIIVISEKRKPGRPSNHRDEKDLLALKATARTTDDLVEEMRKKGFFLWRE